MYKYIINLWSRQKVVNRGRIRGIMWNRQEVVNRKQYGWAYLENVQSLI